MELRRFEFIDGSSLFGMINEFEVDYATEQLYNGVAKTENAL